MKSCTSTCPNLSAVLFTLLFIFSFNSCERTPEPTAEILIKDALIFKQGERKPYTGSVKDTVEGKVIEYSAVDGKKNGEFKTYFKNGKLEMLGQIKQNLNQGKWTYYYPSGQIESEGTFKDDLPDGTWKWFYENGNLKEEGVYIKGNREGRWVMFDVDGKITEEKIFEKNEVQEKK
jgi:antitoxin component YwqK of YwqJK toxin-antitoxin module